MAVLTPTVASLFLERLGHHATGQWPCKEGDNYVSVPAADYYRRVVRLHLGLRSLGLQRGDCCALLSESRWEWAVADLALLTSGIVNVSLDPAIPEEELFRVLSAAGCRSIFISTREQRLKVEAVRKRLSALDSVIAFEGGAGGPASRVFAFAQFTSETRVTAAEREAVQSRMEAIQPNDPASISTICDDAGAPTTVALTQGDWMKMAGDLQMQATAGDVALSFLRPWHAREHAWHYAFHLRGASVGLAGEKEDLAQILEQWKPTHLAGSPAVLERIQEHIHEELAATSRQKLLLRKFLPAGTASEDRRLSSRRVVGPALTDRLVFSKVRGRLGGRLQRVLAVDGRLSPEAAEVFRGVGLSVQEVAPSVEEPATRSVERPSEPDAPAPETTAGSEAPAGSEEIPCEASTGPAPAAAEPATPEPLETGAEAAAEPRLARYRRTIQGITGEAFAGLRRLAHPDRGVETLHLDLGGSGAEAAPPAPEAHREAEAGAGSETVVEEIPAAAAPPLLPPLAHGPAQEPDSTASHPAPPQAPPAAAAPEAPGPPREEPARPKSESNAAWLSAKLLAFARSDKLFAGGEDVALLSREIRSALAGEEAAAGRFRVIVPGRDWLRNPWEGLEATEHPDRWDERIPLVVLPEDPYDIHARLGEWLREHVGRRRNTVRFLIPKAGSANAFLDRDLLIPARAIVKAEAWSEEEGEYAPLRNQYQSELQGLLEVRWDRFAVLEKWDGQEAARCRFQIQQHRAQGGRIAEAIDDCVRQRLFLPEEFENLVLAYARSGETVANLLRELREPRPNGRACIPWLGEAEAKERLVRVCARGKIALTWHHDYLFVRLGEDVQAAYHRMKTELAAGKDLEEMCLRSPEAVGQGQFLFSA